MQSYNLGFFDRLLGVLTLQRGKKWSQIADKLKGSVLKLNKSPKEDYKENMVNKQNKNELDEQSRDTKTAEKVEIFALEF